MVHPKRYQGIVFRLHLVWSDPVDFAHTAGSNYKYHLACAQNRMCPVLATTDMKYTCDKHNYFISLSQRLG